MKVSSGWDPSRPDIWDTAVIEWNQLAAADPTKSIKPKTRGDLYNKAQEIGQVKLLPTPLVQNLRLVESAITADDDMAAPGRGKPGQARLCHICLEPLKGLPKSHLENCLKANNVDATAFYKSKKDFRGIGAKNKQEDLHG